MTPTDDPVLAAKKRRHRNERIAAAIFVLIAAAVAYSFVRWNRIQERALRQDLRYIPKTPRVTPEVLMLRDYVRIDSSAPPGIAAGANWLAAQLARRGVQAELIESAPGYLNVYARIKGRAPGAGVLLFNHIDVIPPGDGWNAPPFEGKIVNDELFGRGALDMKALAICQLLAFADVAASGRRPPHDLVFLATAEEERGSELGMKWLVTHRPDIFEGIRYGITEGGLTEVMSEKMTYFGVEIGGKQLVRVHLTSKDPAVLQKARFALEPWVTMRDAHRVLPEVRTFFRALAPTRIAFAPLLADIDGAIARGDFWKLPVAYRALVQNTVWLPGGPFPWRDAWALRVDLMNLPDESPATRVAWLRERVAPYGVGLEVILEEGPVPLTTTDNSLFRVLTGTAAELYGVPAGSQIGYRTASDARILRPKGILCYGVCPYPVSYFQSLTIHKKNERITIEWFLRGVEYTREVVRRWSAAEDE